MLHYWLGEISGCYLFTRCSFPCFAPFFSSSAAQHEKSFSRRYAHFPLVHGQAKVLPQIAFVLYKSEMCVIPCNCVLHSYPHCYSSFDLSSIYAVKYHLMTRIRLYQLSFLISTIPGPRYRFPALLDLPVI